MKREVKISNISLVIAILIFIALIAQVGYLSLSPIINDIDIQKFASSRTTKRITIPAKRGTIYDSKGNVLAEDVSSYTVIAYLDSSRTINENNPKHVVDKENTALVLSAILDMDYDTVLKYLSKENVYQTEFGPKGKGLNEITKDKILKANLPGIDFIETSKRFYPYGEFASYLIGYAKSNEEGVTVGELGLEKEYNKELMGTNGYTEYQKDRKGYKIPGTSEITQDAIDGSDIHLTIDANVQFFVEEALEKTKKYGQESMTIIVADKKGKILAYASNPSFDPNIRNITNYLDPMTVAFEPGSTMKIYTYMAALEAKVYDGKAKYSSGKFVTKDKTVIKDWNNVGWGYINYDQGFVYSSNTAVVNIMNKYMDANVLKKYLLKLGFGVPTGIGVYNEQSGKINFKYETEIFNAAFGQGITTTALQHIKALTSIANNGIMYNPYIIDNITSGTGEVILSNKGEALGRVASEETVSYIKNLMWRTINDGDGAAHSYSISNFNIIGKTGTAQIAKTNGGGYLSGEENHHRSIAIMFPKDDPEIIIYGVSKYAATSLALSTTVKEIISNLAKYYNIYNQTSTKEENNVYNLDNYLNCDVKDVVKKLSDKKLNVITLGNGNVITQQYPNSNTLVTVGDKVFLLTNSNDILMPDITGYSRSDVSVLASLLNIPYFINGNGYVTSQSIEKGKKVTTEKLEVNLKLLY